MQNKPTVFLDYASTTPVDPEVVEAMMPYFTEYFGNSSSIHKFGQQAEAALENSRHTVAEIIAARPSEIVFTSCGSESDNLALRGVALAERKNRGASHILISPVEHHAVSNTALQLQDLHGFNVEYLPVDQFGIVDPDDVKKYLRPETAIVSVIHANNEIGSINPVQEIGEVCQSHGVPFHTDSVQGAAHLPINVDTLNVDLMSIGAHKFYGPKGVGALYIREGTPIIPELTGGGQENNLRAGTHNTPYIVGLAKAFQLTQVNAQERHAHYDLLRKRIINHILSEIPSARLTGHPDQRLPNHTSFVFQGVDGNTLLMMLDAAGFACSSGSACKTGDPEPSDVLLALGIPRDWALGSLRVTVGQQTTFNEIEDFLNVVPDLIHQVRELISI
ncbi:MAG: cysteine desulfurase [Chloroflexota bacterium]|nr:MAG: cysteine desulfurase [Chloroflexota bacterium]